MINLKIDKDDVEFHIEGGLDDLTTEACVFIHELYLSLLEYDANAGEVFKHLFIKCIDLIFTKDNTKYQEVDQKVDHDELVNTLDALLKKGRQ